MATEVLKLTAQIVISHSSMSELTPKELVDEIREIYNVLTTLEGGEALLEAAAGVTEKGPEAEAEKGRALVDASRGGGAHGLEPIGSRSIPIETDQHVAPASPPPKPAPCRD